MGWLEAPWVPWAAAGVAYVSGLRALLWLADRADRAVPDRLRAYVTARLSRWWERIEETPLPRLARREAGALVARVDAFLTGDAHPTSLKIGVSFLLTALAFLVGNVIHTVARAYGVTLDLYGGPPPETAEVVWSVALTWTGLQALFCAGMWRSLRRPATRVERLYLYSALYLVALYTLPRLDASALILAGFVVAVWRLRLAAPGRRRALIGLTAVALLGAKLQSFGPRWPLLFSDLVIYGANCGFDLMTLAVTLWLLRRIAAGGSLSNLLWIALDVALALLFAICVYAFVLVALNGSLLPLGPMLLDMATYQFATLNVGLLLFAGTTAIPTVAYAAVLVVAHVGRLGHLLAARGSRLLLYDARTEAARTPVYLTFASVALLLSLAPAYVAWLGAVNTLAQAAAP